MRIAKSLLCQFDAAKAEENSVIISTGWDAHSSLFTGEIRKHFNSGDARKHPMILGFAKLDIDSVCTLYVM